MSEERVHILPDRGAVMRGAADTVSALLWEAVAARGVFHLCLAGGTTPAGVYRLLAVERNLPWNRVKFWFGDERGVPPDHADSNFQMARETLLSPLGIQDRQIHRMEGERPDLAAAAVRYARILPRRLDLLLLGLGEDGHIASLFPDSDALLEKRRVVAVVGAKPPPRRLTITPPVIAAARAVCLIACGSEKAVAVARALRGEADPHACPAVLVRHADWFLDQAAGALLSHPNPPNR